jgi:nitrile hydratase
MNGVHDMGGMHGLGPVAPDPDEPLFHAPWEARALALTVAAGALGRWTIDASRHARESIAGPDYLRMTYYEKWTTALEHLLIDAGLVTTEELVQGRAAPDTVGWVEPLTAQAVTRALARGSPTVRVTHVAPRFAVGAGVRARNLNPAGHTRLPRYVRGRWGEIARLHAAHVFPDTNAHGAGEQPQPLYQVKFDAQELWGPDAAWRGAVFLDLWESYLEPA